MKDFGIIAMWAIVALGGIAAGVYLVMHDHPWFALLVFMITASIRVRTGDGEAGHDD